MNSILHKVQDKKDIMVDYLGKNLKAISKFSPRLTFVDVSEKYLMLNKSEFADCPDWRYNKLVVRSSKREDLFVGCHGFPECKNAFSLPKGIDSIHMAEETCKKWEEQGRGKATLFDIAFYQPFYEHKDVAAVLNGTTGGRYCIMKDCDENLKSLIKVWRRVKNKSTFFKVDTLSDDE
jgi:hypothetical protein